MSDHIQKWHDYASARRSYDDAKEMASLTYKALKAAEVELVDAMLEANVTGIPAASGARVSMRPSFTIACNAENKPLIEAWLVDTQGDAEPYKKTDLDKSAVQELIAGKVDDGAPTDSFPAFLNVKSRPTVTVTGWKKHREQMDQETQIDGE